ncbi:MAG TPA: hypothetical protein ENN41_07260 [Sediminispirochaeta sp.]|nr:hypothetical protein [Sediminispirochaeta sp.]
MKRSLFPVLIFLVAGLSFFGFRAIDSPDPYRKLLVEIQSDPQSIQVLQDFLRREPLPEGLERLSRSEPREELPVVARIAVSTIEVGGSAAVADGEELDSPEEPTEGLTEELFESSPGGDTASPGRLPRDAVLTLREGALVPTVPFWDPRGSISLDQLHTVEVKPPEELGRQQKALAVDGKYIDHPDYPLR